MLKLEVQAYSFYSLGHLLLFPDSHPNYSVHPIQGYCPHSLGLLKQPPSCLLRFILSFTVFYSFTVSTLALFNLPHNKQIDPVKRQVNHIMLLSCRKPCIWLPTTLRKKICNLYWPNVICPSNICQFHLLSHSFSLTKFQPGWPTLLFLEHSRHAPP